MSETAILVAGIRPSGAPAAMPMRVLLVAPFAPCGGGMGRIMAYLADYAGPAGVTFELVESRGSGSAAASLLHMLSAASRIIHFSINGTPAIVHLNVGEGGSVVRKGLLLLLADFLGLPTLLHVHAADIIGFHASLPRPARWWMELAFRRATMCVVLGKVWREWLVTRIGVSSSRITIVRNGVPQPGVVRPVCGADPFTVVFLGNLLARKGLPDLIAALAELHAAPGARLPGWQLLVVGGGDARPLRDLAEASGIAGMTRFLGWLDRPAASLILARADVLVLPSLKEGLPLVLLEAASLGVPLIATRVGAVPELFTHGKDALLVDPGDRSALAQALRSLMEDADLASRLGTQARRLYEQQFKMEIFVRRMAEIYARLGKAAQ